MSRKKKNFLLENLSVTAYAAEGKSLGHLEDGKVVFVEGAVPGDVADVWVTKNKSSFAEAKLSRLVTPSPDRVVPFCPHFGTCGGCKWQMIPYELQARYKGQQAEEQLRRISGLPLPQIQPIIPAPHDRYYRNKLEFTFSAQRYRTAGELQEARGEKLADEPALGFHAPGLFDKVVPIHTCYLQPEPTNTLLSVLRRYTEEHGLSYYNFREHRGFLRNVVLRVARTGEVLVNIIFGEDKKEERERMLQHVFEHVPGITSLHYTVNEKKNDTIYDQDVVTWRGPGFIIETLEDFRFKISPKSFFQTNTAQAETLYRLTREAAGLTGEQTLYDLYCGTGSIGIFCSRGAKKIVGIEAVEDAVKDARENAAMNGLEHCEYFAGDVIKICNDDFMHQHGRPDVVITDPPRAGMHEGLVQQLLKMRAPRIVYVSCNPATQARDLKLLSEAYKVKTVQPVDMFPQTHHVECVAMLELISQP